MKLTNENKIALFKFECIRNILDHGGTCSTEDIESFDTIFDYMDVLNRRSDEDDYGFTLPKLVLNRKTWSLTHETCSGNTRYELYFKTNTVYIERSKESPKMQYEGRDAMILTLCDNWNRDWDEDSRFPEFCPQTLGLPMIRVRFGLTKFEGIITPSHREECEIASDCADRFWHDGVRLLKDEKQPLPLNAFKILKDIEQDKIESKGNIKVWIDEETEGLVFTIEETRDLKYQAIESGYWFEFLEDLIK